MPEVEGCIYREEGVRRISLSLTGYDVDPA